MKKLLMVLVCLFALTLVACTNEQEQETPNTPETTDVEYTLGMGVVVNADEAKQGTAQVDSTVAAVVYDKDGKFTVTER